MRRLLSYFTISLACFCLLACSSSSTEIEKKPAEVEKNDTENTGIDTEDSQFCQEYWKEAIKNCSTENVCKKYKEFLDECV